MLSNNWLYSQLQKWTPFSVAVIIIAALAAFVVIWFTIQGGTPPAWAVTLLSVFGTIMGATGLVSHGVTIANGVAKSTASETVKAVSQNLVVSSPVPDSTQVPTEKEG